jgi:endoglucanase
MVRPWLRADITCYERDLAPVARQMPLVAGAVGPTLTASPGASGDCPVSSVRGGGWSAATLDWLDEHADGWAAWNFGPGGDCWSLITDWSGDPTPVRGDEIRNRLAAAS